MNIALLEDSSTALALTKSRNETVPVLTFIGENSFFKHQEFWKFIKTFQSHPCEHTEHLNYTLIHV